MQQLQHIVAVDDLHHGPLAVGVFFVVLVQDDALLDVFRALELVGADDLDDGGGVALEVEKGGHAGQEEEVFFCFGGGSWGWGFLLFLHV
jgi:hypothetical protein